MKARIYKPTRNAMQSGQANTRDWVLVFTATKPRFEEPLMGWTGSDDTQTQVRLSFETKDEAIAYATRNGIAYQLQEPKIRKPVIRPGGYGDNFAYSRKGAWTH